MSLFKRVSDNIRANLNSLLDKAEDPEIMLNQYLRDMEEDIAEAEVAVAKQLAVAWKFKVQLDDLLVQIEKREAQAIEAIKNNREELARRALEDKRVLKAKAEEFKAHYEQTSATAEKLRAELKIMKEEYERLRLKRDTLVARAKAAKAQKQIYEATGSLGKDTTKRNFERMEDKVLQMEAEAKIAEDFRERDLDLQLESLGKDLEIENELAALKESVLGKRE